MLSLIIFFFGLFAIGVMVFSGLDIVSGFLLFMIYFCMACGVMILLIACLAFILYKAEKAIIYGYKVEGDFFCIEYEGHEVFRQAYQKLETKVYKKIIMINENEQTVAFFPEHVRKALLEL